MEPLPLDQLKDFALKSQPANPPVRQLDLRYYWDALREGRPVPLFSPLDSKGKPRAPRHLRAGQVTQLINSPLSPEFYEAAHGVPEIIVRDLRRRHSEGLLVR